MAKPLGLSMGTQTLGWWPRPQQPAPGKSGYLTNGKIRTHDRAPLPHILAFALTNWATLAGWRAKCFCKRVLEELPEFFKEAFH